jgi:hypothetical protein
MGRMRKAYKLSVREPERKGPLKRPGHTWENIIIDLRKTGWEVADWIHLAQDRDQQWGTINTVN